MAPPLRAIKDDEIVETKTHNPLGLEPFEGEAITEIGFIVPALAGGLREPLDVDTVLIDEMKDVTTGDLITVVFQLRKQKVHMDRAKNHDGWKRVDVYVPAGFAKLDDDFALDAIEAQNERVIRAKEASAGIQRLGEPLPDDEDSPF